MIVYEVNLTINDEIFDEYYHWLIKHIEGMLGFHGFQKAEILKEKQDENESKNNIKMTVRYLIESEEDLNQYLKNDAPAMREEGIQKFGNKFSAFRRVFLEPLIFNLPLMQEN